MTKQIMFSVKLKLNEATQNSEAAPMTNPAHMNVLFTYCIKVCINDLLNFDVGCIGLIRYLSGVQYFFILQVVHRISSNWHRENIKNAWNSRVNSNFVDLSVSYVCNEKFSATCKYAIIVRLNIAVNI